MRVAILIISIVLGQSAWSSNACQNEIDSWQEARAQMSELTQARLNYFRLGFRTYNRHFDRLRTSTRPKQALRELIQEENRGYLRALGEYRESMNSLASYWSRNSLVFQNVANCFKSIGRLDRDALSDLEKMRAHRAKLYAGTIDLVRQQYSRLRGFLEQTKNIYRATLQSNTRRRVKQQVVPSLRRTADVFSNLIASENDFQALHHGEHKDLMEYLIRSIEE